MRQFLIKICVAVGNFIGVDKKVAAGIIAGVAVFLLIAFIAIIVAVCKKKKAKKVKAQAKTTQQVSAPTPIKVESKVESEKIDAPIQETTDTKEVSVEKPVEQEKEVKKVSVKSSKPKTTTKKVEEKPVKKLSGKWIIEEKKSDEYIAVLSASNGEVMLTGESYTTAEGAKNGIATIIKGIENGNFIVYNHKRWLR